MRKTVLLPTWRESPSKNLDEPNNSYATITEHAGHRRVLFSGGLAVEGGIDDQVRTILDHRREALRDLGGSMNDVVFTRYFVHEDHLDQTTQALIHETRDEFFDRPHYPASTMIGTSSLLAEDALVEIEVEAEIPDGAWNTDVLTEEDV